MDEAAMASHGLSSQCSFEQVTHEAEADMNNVRVLSAILVLAASSAAAHHGWSGYNEEALKLSGTIQESSYENPHGLATLKTTDKTWKVVLAPVTRMESRGLSREMLKPGTTVSVEGYQHKTDAGELRAERITVAGKTVELR
jgi:hypothetical protein